MMKKFIFIISSLIIFQSSFSQSEIDGYMKNGGNADIALGYTYERFDNFWFGNEKRAYPVSRQSYSLFINQGIHQNINLIASAPYIKSERNEASLQGLQDAAVFLKTQLFRFALENENEISLVMAGGYRFPLTDYRTETSIAYGQKAKSIEGKANLRYWMGKGYFADLQAGYNYRLEPVPSSLPLLLKFGKGSTDVYYDFWLSYQKSFGGIDYPDRRPENTFRELAVDYMRAGGTIYYPFLENMGGFFSGGYTILGRNTGEAYYGSIGLVYKSFHK